MIAWTTLLFKVKELYQVEQVTGRTIDTPCPYFKG